MPPRKKTEPAPQPAEGEQPDPGTEEGTVGDQQVVLSSWQFIDDAPTEQQVRDLLATLPDCYGVPYSRYYDYVQALPQRLKIEKQVPNPSGSGTHKETEYHESWALYMSVAGRVKMAEEIALRNGWLLDFEPEPVTPTGIPGILQHGRIEGENVSRIVYREYAVFRGAVLGEFPYWDGGTFSHYDTSHDGMVVIGRKPGMAWVPYSGGSGAAESNPYEKVETSARGRALGAWGIGILPGSGIASLEEMQSIAGNQRAARAQQQEGDPRVVPAGQQRKPKEDLVTDALTIAEEIRQARGLEPEEMRDRLVRFLSSDLGIMSVYDAEIEQIDWKRVKPGQVQLLINSLADSLQKIRNEQADL